MSADNNKPEKRPGKFGKLLNFIVIRIIAQPLKTCLLYHPII
jgi:hypothetical protein